MTNQNQIDHQQLVEHARKLDSEARNWTKRELPVDLL